MVQKPPINLESIREQLFPDTGEHHIPVIAVTGANGKSTTTGLIAHLIRCTGRFVASACISSNAQIVLRDTRVHAAVLDLARRVPRTDTRGLDRCEVVVVTNISSSHHFGVQGFATFDELTHIKQIVAKTLSPSGSAVLNADDPLAAALAAHCKSPVVFFSRTGRQPTILEQRHQRGRAVFGRDRRIILAEGEQEIPLTQLENVPLMQDECVALPIDCVLAATAAAWSLGIPCELIRAGLASFHTNLDGGGEIDFAEAVPA